MTLALDGRRNWVCPNCDRAEVSQGPGARFHPCPGLAGLLAPMVLDGVRCQVRAVVRGDYVGAEDVRYDEDGRPVMSVITERDTGQDCAVYAPAARVTRS